MKNSKTIMMILAIICIAAVACYAGMQMMEENSNDVPSEGGVTTPEEVPPSDRPEENPDGMNMIIQIGNQSFRAVLYDNDSVRALLQNFPLSVNMIELNGNEKYYRFSENLPSNDEGVGQIHTGDIMLYSSSYLVLFYEDFSTSYSYTKLGYVENPAGLAEALGSGNVRVSFSIEN